MPFLKPNQQCQSTEGLASDSKSKGNHDHSFREANSRRKGQKAKELEPKDVLRNINRTKTAKKGQKLLFSPGDLGL